MMPQDLSNLYYIFVAVAALNTAGAKLNMGQSDSINNRTVKFVVSYCIVFKQVELSTILALVESTGSWLHDDTCPVFVR